MRRTRIIFALLGIVGFASQSQLTAQQPRALQISDVSSTEPGAAGSELDANAASPAKTEGGDVNIGDLDNLLDQDLDTLSRNDVVVPEFDTEVTSVSRQESTVGRSPAAIFVITNEMIRHSGARSIPEVLRMAPGVNVAKLGTNKWAVSIRGFNNTFSNKLLVQIDGRTVYTPLFAGVFWDVQDVLLEDVERIEIVRGPGATVWGANAVNGIINIITKRAEDTVGVFGQVGGGTEEKMFSAARIGGRIGNNAYWRIYGKWWEGGRGSGILGAPTDDGRQGRGGARIDWEPTCCDTFTFQGDLYRGETGQFIAVSAPTNPPSFMQSFPESSDVAGGNALFRWTHSYDDDSDWSIQMYYDRTDRFISTFTEKRDTFDLDFQHRFRFQQYHSIIWGLGYRHTTDILTNDEAVGFIPSQRNLDIISWFIQDEMTLLEDELYFTLGSKFSDNDFTGFEFQPTARLLWAPTKRQSLWAAVSRAVRTPARSDHDVFLIQNPTQTTPFPIFPLVQGNRQIESEQLLAWEAGYRAAPTDDWFWDVAAFLNRYEDLVQIGSAGTPFFSGGGLYIPIPLQNTTDAWSYGFEITSTYKVNPCWDLRAAYSFLRLDLDEASTSDAAETQSPRNQIYVQSTYHMGYGWSVDLMGRYVDALFAEAAPSYVQMDSRIAYHPNDQLEIAVVGRNLLDRDQREFYRTSPTGVYATGVEREVYGVISYRY